MFKTKSVLASVDAETDSIFVLRGGRGGLRYHIESKTGERPVVRLFMTQMDAASYLSMEKYDGVVDDGFKVSAMNMYTILKDVFAEDPFDTDRTSAKVVLCQFEGLTLREIEVIVDPYQADKSLVFN